MIKRKYLIIGLSIILLTITILLILHFSKGGSPPPNPGPPGPPPPNPGPPSPSTDPCKSSTSIFYCDNADGMCKLVKDPTTFDQFMFNNLSSCKSSCLAVDSSKPHIDANDECATKNSTTNKIDPTQKASPCTQPTTCLMAPDGYSSICATQKTSVGKLTSACSGGSKPHPWKGPTKPYPPSPKHDSSNPGFKISDFTPGKWNGDGIKASTTNFGFGGNTSCACNGHELEKELAKIGYVGVATPNWLQSTYNTSVTGSASGNATPSELQGTDYISNCSLGPGGCAKCFALTTTDKVDVLHQQKPIEAGHTIKTVVLDTCEDRNAYGNNYQWCIAASNQTPTDTKGYSGETPEKDQPLWGPNLRFGQFKTDKDTGKSTWIPPSDCVDTEGNWICTNVAGAPLHFDFGIQDFIAGGSITPENMTLLKNINPDVDWSKWDNPVVTAVPIPCDPKVLDTLKGKCGANASDPANTQTCMYYCPPFDQGPTSDKPIAPWWGGCDNDNWNCAPPNADCSKQGCCLFGQKCEGNKDYMGCSDPK